MSIAAWVLALALPQDAPPVAFEKKVLTDKYYCDGINAGDVNGDGKTDVVAGPFWYEGPGFEKKHEFYPAVVHPTEPSPTNSMFSYLYDFNGDGRTDILKLGRVHKHQALWFENPGDREGHWKAHIVFERIRGESPPFVDIDGDGKPEIISHWDNRWGWIRPDRTNPARPWAFRPVSVKGKYNQFYHGTGVGDVNGDGRPDLVINDGWWENSDAREWTWHPQKFGEQGGAQIGVYDVDGDGDNDVVSSLNAHHWGLAWFEQVKKEGKREFRKHMIMGDRSEEKKYGVAFSQPHAMDYADLDGDGLKDIVVGKRMWAHGPKGDVEPNAAPVVTWFRLVRDGGTARFVPYRIDDTSGVGVQIRAADVNGDGRIDVLTASKLGTFVFLNRKPAGPR